MNVAFRSQTRALLLSLMVALDEVAYDRMQVLVFLLGMGWDGRRSPLAGLTFIRDARGPFSPEVDDIIASLIREGLCQRYGDGGQWLRLTLAGRSVALQYGDVVPEISRHVERAVPKLAFLERSLGPILGQTRRGDVLIPPRVDHTLVYGD